MADEVVTDQVNAEHVDGVFPPLLPATAQVIANALFHQYGENCGFVICLMPADDIAMVESAPVGAELERMPRVAVAKASMSDGLAAQLMRNVLEAYDRKVTAADHIGETKGEA